MNTATLNVKTDPETKQQMQQFAAELGVPVSVILNAQMKQMLRDRRVTLSTELEPTPYLIEIMKEVEKTQVSKKDSTTVSSPEELLAHLAAL